MLAHAPQGAVPRPYQPQAAHQDRVRARIDAVREALIITQHQPRVAAAAVLARHVLPLALHLGLRRGAQHDNLRRWAERAHSRGSVAVCNAEQSCLCAQLSAAAGNRPAIDGRDKAQTMRQQAAPLASPRFGCAQWPGPTPGRRGRWPCVVHAGSAAAPSAPSAAKRPPAAGAPAAAPSAGLRHCCCCHCCQRRGAAGGAAGASWEACRGAPAPPAAGACIPPCRKGLGGWQLVGKKRRAVRGWQSFPRAHHCVVKRRPAGYSSRSSGPGGCRPAGPAAPEPPRRPHPLLRSARAGTCRSRGTSSRGRCR
jgi:hypothetical protein